MAGSLFCALHWAVFRVCRRARACAEADDGNESECHSFDGNSHTGCTATFSLVMHSITRLHPDSRSKVVKHYPRHQLDPGYPSQFIPLTKWHRRHQRRYTRQNRQGVMHAQGIEPGHRDDGESPSSDISCECDEAEGARGEDGVANG